jgi:hypothetical protein
VTNYRALRWLFFLGLASCAASVTTNQPAPGAPAQLSAGSQSLPVPPPGAVYGSQVLDGRIVVYTLSSVVLTPAGTPVRVVGLTEVPLPGSRRLGSAGVQEVTLNHAGPVGYSHQDGLLLLHPKDGMLWSDVSTESDLVLESR